MLFYHKYDSLQFHIKKDQKDISLIILGRIYPTETKATLDSVYNQMHEKLTNKTDNDKQNVGLTEALTGTNYWRATWIGMFLACANISTGINAVNVYTLTIFETIQKNSGNLDGGLKPSQSVSIIGIANFVTAILSFWSSKPFKTRRV